MMVRDLLLKTHLYRSLARALQYLTFTIPNFTYVIQQICLYMHDPRKPHFIPLKRILRYVRGTTDHGLQIFYSPSRDIIAYFDARLVARLLGASLLVVVSY